MNTNRILIVLGSVLVLGVVNFSIFKKESIKRDGEIVFLELAPVDPRSLMQGDYMALRFALAEKLSAQVLDRQLARDEASRLIDGKVDTAAIEVDSRRVAVLVGSKVGGGDSANADQKLKLRYRIRNGQAWLGTNAFFFEEGTAERYNAARYGEFRVDVETGEAVLVGLRDIELKAL